MACLKKTTWRIGNCALRQTPAKTPHSNNRLILWIANSGLRLGEERMDHGTDIGGGTLNLALSEVCPMLSNGYI